MSDDIAEHVTKVFENYGYDYSGSLAVLAEITQACRDVGMTVEEFDNTHLNYRTQYTIQPSGWWVLARFRPRRADIDKAQQKASHHIFHWVEREGWQGGLRVIYDGICGVAAKRLAEQWSLDIDGPAYAGLPELWQQYFELLHSGNMYAAYMLMAHSDVSHGSDWHQLASQVEMSPGLALNKQPYLKKLVRSGKVQLVNPTVKRRKKRKWVIQIPQKIDVPAIESDEFLFDVDDSTEGQ